MPRKKYLYTFIDEDRIKQRYISGQRIDDECVFTYFTFKKGCDALNLPHRSIDQGDYPKQYKNWYIKREEL